jgi:hypothetical protein
MTDKIPVNKINKIVFGAILGIMIPAIWSFGEVLSGMLGLSFVPGKGLIIAGIIAGGLVLIGLQYMLTRLVLYKTIKFSESIS